MDTIQINKILERCDVTRDAYIGCFAADRIPPVTRYPCCMVLNTEPATSEGAHWVAVFLPSADQIDYFDSLADWPAQSSHIAAFLARFSRVNRCFHPLQSERSSACGKHVIYFLYRRCQGWPLERVCRHLAGSKSGADRLVCAFTRKQIFGEKQLA